MVINDYAAAVRNAKMAVSECPELYNTPQKIRCTGRTLLEIGPVDCPGRPEI